MRKILAVSIAISILISILGFYLALYFDLIISGMISSLLGLLFFLVFLFNPQNGYFSHIIQQKKRKIENHISLLVVHLSQHENTEAQAKECNKSNIAKHLFWNPHHTQKISNSLYFFCFSTSGFNSLLRRFLLNRTQIQKSINFSF